MSVRFHCPHCGKRMKTPNGSAGKKTRCPQCAKMLRVPDAVEDPSPPADPERGTRRSERTSAKRRRQPDGAVQDFGDPVPPPRRSDDYAPPPDKRRSRSDEPSHADRASRRRAEKLDHNLPLTGAIGDLLDEDANPIVVESKLKEPPARKLPATAPRTTFDPETLRDGPAWERQGADPATYFATLVAGYSNPSQFFRTMRRTGGAGGAVGFALTSYLIIFLVNLGYSMLLGPEGVGLSMAAQGEFGVRGYAFAAGYILALVIGIPIVAVLIATVIYFWAGIIHLLLRMFGARDIRFRCTVKVMAYSLGCAYFLGLIPVVGLFAIAPVAGVLLVIGLVRMQEVGIIRAVLSAVVMASTNIIFFLLFLGLLVELPNRSGNDGEQQSRPASTRTVPNAPSDPWEGRDPFKDDPFFNQPESPPGFQNDEIRRPPQ